MQRTEINETGLEVMEDIDDSDYIFIVGSDGSLKSMLLPEDFEIQLTPENVDKVLQIFRVQSFHSATVH
jgi:hypothetical protein